MTDRPRVIRHLSIRGRVQGVGYRDWMERNALSRGLEGWVRNRRDGSVEAALAGPDTQVHAMVESCWRGPVNARVDVIDQTQAEEPTLEQRRLGELFSVLRTV